MTIKDKFIEEINTAIDEGKIVLSEEANQYLTSLQKVIEKPKFTENGKKILVYMQDNYKDNNNIFNAKGIGEGLFLSSPKLTQNKTTSKTINKPRTIKTNFLLY